MKEKGEGRKDEARRGVAESSIFEIGKIAFTGPRDGLINDERIKKAYLGS
jgi:ABC-type lipopolysaccharide export system ATPase subunit